MKITTILAALTLGLAPGLALAQDCRGKHRVDETAASCMPGLVWDEAKSTCVEKPTS